MSIKVKATKKGFHGRLRQEGEEFEIADESELGSWMERLDGGKKPAAAKKTSKKKTGSGGNQESSDDQTGEDDQSGDDFLNTGS